MPVSRASLSLRSRPDLTRLRTRLTAKVTNKHHNQTYMPSTQMMHLPRMRSSLYSKTEPRIPISLSLFSQSIEKVIKVFVVSQLACKPEGRKCVSTTQTTCRSTVYWPFSPSNLPIPPRAFSVYSGGNCGASPPRTTKPPRITRPITMTLRMTGWRCPYSLQERPPSAT